MTWRLTKIRLQGVKGVLKRAGDFDLPDGRSIAIYAPNGCGKSGYADALEYLFSLDGAVEHLGQGSEDSERGGKHALPHVLAQQTRIDPQVSITLRNIDSNRLIEVKRPVKTGRNDPVPADLAPLIHAAPAHRILRQHDLRRFVVEMAPHEKYSELSRWLGLERLEETLDHLTSATTALQNTTVDRELAERVKDVSLHTNQAVTVDDETAALLWCQREAVRHLGEEISVESANDLVACIERLQARRNEVVVHANKATPAFNAKLVLEDAVAKWPAKGGLLDQCDAALKNLAAAEHEVEKASAAAVDGKFQEAWTASLALMTTETLATCPVCSTPWEQTVAKSQQAAVERMRSGIEALGDLRRSLEVRKSATASLTATMGVLQSALVRLEESARTLELTDLASDVSVLLQKTRGATSPSRPGSQVLADYVASVMHCREVVTRSLPPLLGTVQLAEIPAAATELDASVEHIRALKDALTRLAELRGESKEIRRVEAGFAAVAQVIRESTQRLLNEVLGALRDDVRAIYKKIHPNVDIRNIHIELGTKAKSLILRVAFHSDDRRVPPGGYLSEAQINTLGLALFVATVRLFNREFPFIVLDDIVSSYDADNRLRIVDVIAEDLTEFQVFLTTHDERFYDALKRRLEDKHWRFERITGWTLEEGPKRQTDLLKPHQVEELIRSGHPEAAGNAVRRYMEEWLDDMCAKYEAYTLHKRRNKEFDRTLFDFWGPFVDRLEQLRGGWFLKYVRSSECFERLRGHGLLNYYTHAQANPYEWGSIGDVKYVWEEFRRFQQLFDCKSCGKQFRFDRGTKRLFCTCSADTDSGTDETAA